MTNKSRIIGIIPARMGSSRFPGKPLAPILGHSLIEHVYRRTALCSMLDEVYVATCDAEIRAHAEGFGGKVIMTSDRHERASDRVAEAAGRLEADIVLMVQGDEPMIVPEMIEDALSPLLSDIAVQCVNLAKRIETEAEYRDVNTVKVVMDRFGDALFFSRAPVPATHAAPFETMRVYKQVCVIPFRRPFLLQYAQLPPTPLERAESIDMLRILEHGYRVRCVETNVETRAVDTPEDLAAVEARMRGDALIAKYARLSRVRTS